MKEITVEKKLQVFSRDDIVKVIQHIGKVGYFSNDIEEFDSMTNTLDAIEISDPDDMDIFVCDDGAYSLFAMIKE